MSPRQIRFNAFDMNCVAHQSSGLWRHPRDRSATYNTLEYWTELAKLLESGTFDELVARNGRFAVLARAQFMATSTLTVPPAATP